MCPGQIYCWRQLGTYAPSKPPLQGDLVLSPRRPPKRLSSQSVHRHRGQSPRCPRGPRSRKALFKVLEPFRKDACPWKAFCFGQWRVPGDPDGSAPARPNRPSRGRGFSVELRMAPLARALFRPNRHSLAPALMFVQSEPRTAWRPPPAQDGSNKPSTLCRSASAPELLRHGGSKVERKSLARPETHGDVDRRMPQGPHAPRRSGSSTARAAVREMGTNHGIPRGKGAASRVAAVLVETRALHSGARIPCWAANGTPEFDHVDLGAGPRHGARQPPF